MKGIMILIHVFLVFIVCQINAKSNKTEKCNERTQFMCGDICTGADAWYSCNCGSVELGKFSTEYCCIDPEDKCIKYESEWSKKYYCPRGRPVRKSEPCNAVCYENNVKTLDLSTTSEDENITCSYNTLCPYAEYSHWYMCGDVCTDGDYNCTCGDNILTIDHTQHYCCLQAGDHCTAGYKGTVCVNGKVNHMSEQCGEASCQTSEIQNTYVLNEILD